MFSCNSKHSYKIHASILINDVPPSPRIHSKTVANTQQTCPVEDHVGPLWSENAAHIWQPTVGSLLVLNAGCVWARWGPVGPPSGLSVGYSH